MIEQVGINFFARFVLLALAGLVLASCTGDGVQPFSKANAPSGKTPPAITVTAMSGMPADKALILFNDLALSAGKRDIAIVQGAFAKGYSMSGEFQALPTASGTAITYRWTVYNGARQVIHTIASTETARIGGADPWSGVDPDLLRRIAGFTTENLSSRLNALGYATRLSGLPPPGSLAKAGPNAGKQIDYETLYGPGAVGPPATTNAAAPPPVLPRQPVRETLTTPQRPSQVNPPQTPVKQPIRTATLKRKPVKAKIKIDSVAMTAVTGSPGRGNADLLLAMRKVMRKSGWPVLTRPARNALTVTGKVRLGKPNGNQQKVAVAWTVRTPDGKVLGTVRQANNVPAGSLNKGWGKNATYVSQAAAQGIFKLVNKVK